MSLPHLAFIPSTSHINIIKGFVVLILAVLIVAITPLCAADKHNIVPCDIKLVFGTDDAGMSVVSYDLEMQIKNQQGRTIRGVSVHWLNAKSEVIGNSDAACGSQNVGIKLAQSGSCRRTIQKIGGRLLEKLGKETWTSIINSEMYNFRAVKYCAIIGYSFDDNAVNRY